MLKGGKKREKRRRAEEGWGGGEREEKDPKENVRKVTRRGKGERGKGTKKK